MPSVASVSDGTLPDRDERAGPAVAQVDVRAALLDLVVVVESRADDHVRGAVAVDVPGRGARDAELGTVLIAFRRPRRAGGQRIDLDRIDRVRVVDHDPEPAHSRFGESCESSADLAASRVLDLELRVAHHLRPLGRREVDRLPVLADRGGQRSGQRQDERQRLRATVRRASPLRRTRDREPLLESARSVDVPLDDRVAVILDPVLRRKQPGRADPPDILAAPIADQGEPPFPCGCLLDAGNDANAPVREVGPEAVSPVRRMPRLGRTLDRSRALPREVVLGLPDVLLGPSPPVVRHRSG